ncbi:hypothetical protein [Clostridium aminobutyricum]|uniref:Uncharacterized protein n=1 Tax=Clostridium aminobutyricum TaxID=33953 RepID=A0A939DA01_CLOAM|nr:hypothetical protein [Clostridium aminobutyricum]MBN7774129.1 hypothetical protein [Clostridium aminobutyricum]
MEYIKYNKELVLLQEENRDFAARLEQSIYGNMRIETGNNKGAIRISVQNLRFFDRGRYVYKLILFGEKKERTIHVVIGTLILNKFGIGENYFRFDPNNVEGKGASIDDYSVAIVAAVSMKNEKEPLHPVLKGKLELARDEPSKKQVISAAGLTKSETEPEEEEPEAEGAEGSEDSRKTPYEVEKRAPIHEKKPVKKYNHYYNEYLMEICQRTAKASEFYEIITPFSEDRTRARWRRVANVQNLPIVSPGALWGASKYRHYIFGEGPDKYYFGIPGRFLNEEQPEGGRSGFVLWQPIMGAESLEATKEDCSLENRMTAYGYWIAAIDKNTGDILDI